MRCTRGKGGGGGSSQEMPGQGLAMVYYLQLEFDHEV
jgi:hypothetical protein